MAELLEQIKQLSREEQLALVQQIYALEDEREVVEDAQWNAELIRRAQELIKNPGSGKSWEEVEARLRADIESRKGS